MDKIKILQFPVGNSKGGITKYVMQNWKFIDKSRFQFDFATMSKILDFADELEKEGSKIYYISCYAEDDKERFIDEFTRILTEGKYDIVHLHTKQWKSFLVEQIAKTVGVKKIIVHAHNTGIDVLDDKERRSQIQLHDYMKEQLTEDIATDFWTCSWKAADFIFGDKIPRAKIKLMNNAIDLTKYAYNPKIRKEYREKLGISDDEFVIGNIGRFVYQKNQEFLIKVFAELCNNKERIGRKYKLLLVGSGEREQEYRKMISDFKLEEKVIFTGYRQDVPELLQAMDIFCFPSRFEGLGIALIEAQASGLVCIVSSEVPKDGIINSNVILLPLDIKIWGEKILEISDKLYMREYKKANLLENKYNIRNQINYIEKEYLC